MTEKRVTEKEVLDLVAAADRWAGECDTKTAAMVDAVNANTKALLLVAERLKPKVNYS